MKEFMRILLILIYAVTMIFSFYVYGKQHTATLELSNKVDSLEYELQQSEERCKRMTDTCIDILANKRW